MPSYSICIIKGYKGLLTCLNAATGPYVNLGSHSHLTPFASSQRLQGTFNVFESESEVAQSCPTLCDSWAVVGQAPPSMGFSRQEYWTWLPFPSPGDLPDSGIKPRSPVLQADFTIWATRESLIYITLSKLSIQHQTLKIKGCKNP